MEKVLKFSSTNQFRKTIREWCLLNGRDVRHRPNDSKRCRQHRKQKIAIGCVLLKVEGLTPLGGKHSKTSIYV